ATVPATPADNLAFKPEPKMNTDHLLGLEKLSQDQDKMAITVNGRDQSAANLGDISGLDMNGTRSYAGIAGPHADKAAEMNPDSSKRKSGGIDTVTLSSTGVLSSSGTVNSVVASANPVAITRADNRELTVAAPVAQTARFGVITEGEALKLDGALRSDIASPAKPATEMITGKSNASVEVAKSGNGNWTLNGGNAFTGTTTISAGTLEAKHGLAVGNTSGTVTLTYSSTAQTSHKRQLWLRCWRCKE
ncbi:MAG: autotransporter-associated beta strand repeat-containing protein, partial [Verrucomicrobia bacterium]|nr:autotransporter-associated beta strand repeat-containing protein [Verrucomicrobiota bacterium]